MKNKYINIIINIYIKYIKNFLYKIIKRLNICFLGIFILIILDSLNFIDLHSILNYSYLNFFNCSKEYNLPFDIIIKLDNIYYTISIILLYNIIFGFTWRIFLIGSIPSLIFICFKIMVKSSIYFFGLEIIFILPESVIIEVLNNLILNFKTELFNSNKKLFDINSLNIDILLSNITIEERSKFTSIINIHNWFNWKISFIEIIDFSFWEKFCFFIHNNNYIITPIVIIGISLSINIIFIWLNHLRHEENLKVLNDLVDALTRTTKNHLGSYYPEFNSLILEQSFKNFIEFLKNLK